MATPDSTARKRVIFIPPGLNFDRYVTALSRPQIALLALVLGTCVACTTGTLAQVPPGQAPGHATSPAPGSREAFLAREAHSFTLLSNVLAKTERVAAFRLDKPCFKCKDSSLEVKDILPSIVPVPLSEERAAEAKRLLARKDSFVLIVTKSCKPLFAKVEGLVLYQPGAVSIFLIFPECEMARLVLETESPPYLFNVDPIYSTLTSLLESLK